jgi:hypothetical protein
VVDVSVLRRRARSQGKLRGLKAYVSVLHEQADDLIHPGGFGDYNASGTSYFFHNTVILWDVAEILDHSNDADRYATLAEDIASAFHDRFFDPDRGIYQTSPATMQSSLKSTQEITNSNSNSISHIRVITTNYRPKYGKYPIRYRVNTKRTHSSSSVNWTVPRDVVPR